MCVYVYNLTDRTPRTRFQPLPHRVQGQPSDLSLCPVPHEDGLSPVSQTFFRVWSLNSPLHHDHPLTSLGLPCLREPTSTSLVDPDRTVSVVTVVFDITGVTDPRVVFGRLYKTPSP